MPPPGLLRLLVIFHEGESLGAGSTVARTLPELEAFGWTTSAWFSGPGPLAEAMTDRLATTAVQARPLAVSIGGWRERPGALARVLRTPGYLRAFRATLERTRPHVVHANTLLSLPEAIVARRYGLPVVLQAHEIPNESAKRTAAIRLASETADVLVGVSDAVSNMLRPAAGDTPVHTVHNGTPVVGERAPRAEGPFTIGTVGTVSRVKGTDTFLLAAQTALGERSGLRFEHVGSPHLHRDRDLDMELAALLTTQDERVKTLGSRPAAEIVPNWDVFVLPSRSEGFPLATLEAMALGLPVVATTVGGVPEQIEHLRTGILVRPNDHEAIAAWIVRLHDDPDLRMRLGGAAAERVRTLFTVSRQAEGMHRAYLTALNRCFGPPNVRRVRSKR